MLDQEKKNKIIGTQKSKKEEKKEERDTPCQLCGRNETELFDSPESKNCKRCSNSTKKCFSCGLVGTWKNYVNFNCPHIFKQRNSKVCNDCENKINKTRIEQQAKLPTKSTKTKKDEMQYSNRFALLADLDD